MGCSLSKNNACVSETWTTSAHYKAYFSMQRKEIEKRKEAGMNFVK